MVAVQAPTRKPQPAFTNLTQAAEYLGVHRRTLSRAIRAGELPCLRLGGQILIPVSALEPKFVTDGGSR